MQVNRVVRGGCSVVCPRNCSAAIRGGDSPSFGHGLLCFRVVLVNVSGVSNDSKS